MSTQTFQIFFNGIEYEFDIYQVEEDEKFIHSWFCVCAKHNYESCAKSYREIILEMYECAKFIQTEHLCPEDVCEEVEEGDVTPFHELQAFLTERELAEIVEPLSEAIKSFRTIGKKKASTSP